MKFERGGMLGWCMLNTFFTIYDQELKCCLCFEFYPFHSEHISLVQCLKTSCMEDYIRFQMNLRLQLKMMFNTYNKKFM